MTHAGDRTYLHTCTHYAHMHMQAASLAAVRRAYRRVSLLVQTDHSGSGNRSVGTGRGTTPPTTDATRNIPTPSTTLRSKHTHTHTR